MQADLAFVGGAVYTVDAARRWAQAVAVRDGRIVAVGTDAEVREHAGPRTEVVDLRGRMLLPGFQDAHVHALGGGLERIQCDLTEGRTVDEYLATIRAYADGHPDSEWILGGGWSMQAFPGGLAPAAPLDAAVPGRKVFLFNRDHHGAWVSTAALGAAGITRDTPDPADGRIERDERGDPTGTLHEGAMDLVGRVAPTAGSEDLYRGLIEGQRYLHSLGVTSWQDALVGTGIFGADTFPAYLRAAETGDLTARVVGALWWERDRDESQVEELLDRRSQATVGRFRATSVKIMQDGVCEDFTAGMIDPYLDADGRPTQNRGLSFVDPEKLKGYVARLDREGFQVHVHALGERAVREALDAIEAARLVNGPADHRHHLAHIQVVRPEDIPRFRALEVVANAQPLWACAEPQMTELTIPFLGEPRWRHQYPFGSLHRSGAALAFGSDWPVSSPNPLEGIHVAVNRTPPPGEDGADAEPFLPEERIDLPTALAAYTIGSAYVNHAEAERGSIEAGKLADLVVLDRNLFEQPESEIGLARVLATYVEGQPVFTSPSL